ncbi:MAG: hypothetical protein ACYSUF_00470 [Planctomycetota bacterium]
MAPATLLFSFGGDSFLQIDVSELEPGEVDESRLTLWVGGAEVGAAALSGAVPVGSGGPSVTLIMEGIFRPFTPAIVDHGAGRFSVAVPSPTFTGPGVVPDAEAEMLCTTGLVADCNNNTVLDIVDIQGGASPDCNGNGVPDECDIAAGTSTDCNGNGMLDECEETDPCRSDIDGDCDVDVVDFLLLLADWGPCSP